jgi:starch synthase
LAVLLFEIYKHHGMDRQRVCHTIHNFRHQGTASEKVLWATGLGRPHYYYTPDRLQDDFNKGALNLTKGAITFSNFVTTVSPHHAWEARHTDQGHGLGHILHVHQTKFGGILNGLDYETWNPATDGSIARRYSADTLEVKYENKIALRNRFWLRDGYKPLIAYVGRLDSQKGVHLIRHALFYAINNGAQFVLLGTSPEHGINAHFSYIKHQLNDHPDCHIELSFDEDLARLIYAGADLIVVPSVYEPCGLTQLIALRYATVPIVRAVGGLADTVFDRDNAPQPPAERNGYVFDHANTVGLESAMSRAIGLWNLYPDEFRKLMKNGIRQDYSWNKPGSHYLDIYEYIRYK